MAVQTSYPGVYVQEVPSGVRTIMGVSTSIAVFIGRTKKGPLNIPVQCLSYTAFVREFSDEYAGSELAQSVKLFFLNGGTECFVVRVADNAKSADVVLRNLTPADVLKVSAKSAGLFGDDIRIGISYNGPNPEATFNMEIFRWTTNVSGQRVKADLEQWQGLSMDPLAARYAPLFVTQNSSLVNVEDKFTLPLPAPPPVLPAGFSQSGRPIVNDTDANFRTELNGILAKGRKFRISVNGGAFVNVDLTTINLTAAPLNAANQATILTAIENLINAALPASTPIVLSQQAGPPKVAVPTGLLRISSATGDVIIEQSPGDDLAKALMLGNALGGLEIPRYAVARPVPTGLFFKIADLVSLAGRKKTAFDKITVNGVDTVLTGPYNINLPPAGQFFQDSYQPTPTLSDGNDGLREKLAIMVDAINNTKSTNPAFKWTAQSWGQRLVLLPGEGNDNSVATIKTSGADNVDIAANFIPNVRYYSLGTTGTGTFQTPGQAGSDGNPPKLKDYTDTFPILDKEVDLFNLVVLPTDAGHTAMTRSTLWGPTSVFCQEKRAFLLMDGPDDWSTVQKATNPTTGVNSLRIGLVKDHSAIFFPRLTINENNLNKQVGATGAIAGLMARTDGTRGVWKAPAGTEADLRGINGLEYRFSDRDNGQLNPQAINTIRIFPNGIVNWGARTMDGDDDFASEYKYIPVRRTALFIEESLYRGLKWVVFEPNDEPLWAQIRLNVGAFMHNLFRQGAFQGKTKQDAYFVRCDGETTTQNDINLGIVNIWVGFAPLKPAEFVVLYLQQMTGQIQV
ncbi:phage tail sheath family protein [Flavihumibacter fluvii]|uniref:phage tail sheath family protein n=1 Tax=Flavihumibacter fluvii TaxID=2838157 RepID=UPI001BDE2AD7|nr:phage tail sheath C-terminal domain-containing protein [Flavihumibacter fluvii]ULQ53226.1 phage tail sheath subtilisin-like domain-containing protein [Flavihumibacter fluvii]